MTSEPGLGNPQALNDLLLYRTALWLSTASTMVIRLCEGRFGITRREWRLIAALAEEGPMQPSQLAVRVQLDRARTSRAITSLAAKKMLERQVHSGDRRHARVTLTPQGQALHAALFPLIRSINQNLLAPLSAAEVEQLDSILRRLQTQADALAQAADLPKANRRRGRSLE